MRNIPNVSRYCCFKFATCPFLPFQMEIAKRLNAIIAQLLPFLSQEVSLVSRCSHIFSQTCPNDNLRANFALQHQQQVVTAVERAKQVSMSELNAIIGVSTVFETIVVECP